MSKFRLFAAVATLILAGGASAAHAAMIVHDPTSYAKLIQQAKTALDQLNELKAQVQQGEKLFQSLNEASNVGQIARELGLPAVRQALPELAALQAAARGDLTALGPLGARIDAIRRAHRVTDPAAGPLDEGLEEAGRRAARDLAVGEAAISAGGERLKGLVVLQDAIDRAPTARAVLDLQARALTEQAMIANDQMRLQGLAMSQAAEARLKAQQDHERMAARRAARMDVYRGAF